MDFTNLNFFSVLNKSEISNPDFVTPLPEIVDECIQNCPIDVRRPLYKNIVLSGGSSMFKDFDRRYSFCSFETRNLFAYFYFSYHKTG